MIDPEQLLRFIIRPVLQSLGLHSVAAERLVLGTACQESECGRWVKQIGGPALGIYQMEPDTWLDHLKWLDSHPELKSKCQSWSAGHGFFDLIGNLHYATAMCRIHYWRVPTALPTDLPGQAAYWKRHYNTAAGAGTEEQYRSNWRRFVNAEWT